MEIVQELRTRDSMKAKFEAALGFNQPSPEDVIHREDYDSDAAYAVALARMTQTMNTPEYRSAARKVGVDRQQEDEREVRRREREQLAKIRKNVTLDDLDMENINSEAQRLAKLDLAKGRIKVSQLGDAIVEHAEKLTEKKKDEKAHSSMINSMIRNEIARNKIE